MNAHRIPAQILTLLFVIACNPQRTGQKFHLYVSRRDSGLYSDAVAAASREARKQGTELLVQSLDDFGSAAAIAPLDAGDALALVAYEEDWTAKLESQFKAIQSLRRDLRLGLWLLGRSTAPSLPDLEWAGQNFDAVSSASAERPARAGAKKFFKPLVEFRGKSPE